MLETATIGRINVRRVVFRNRRQVGALSGLTPTPCRSRDLICEEAELCPEGPGMLFRRPAGIDVDLL